MGGGEFHPRDKGGDVLGDLGVGEPTGGVVRPAVAAMLQGEGAVAGGQGGQQRHPAGLGGGVDGAEGAVQQQKRLALPLLLVVHPDVVDLGVGHRGAPLVGGWGLGGRGHRTIQGLAGSPVAVGDRDDRLAPMATSFSKPPAVVPPSHWSRLPGPPSR